MPSRSSGTATTTPRSGCARFTGPFILRRLKTDNSIITDLPEKLEMDVVCNLTAEQAALYQAVVDDMMEKIDNSEGIERRGLVLATMTKLKQVCNHPAHFLRDGSRLAGRSGKLERLDEIIAEVLDAGEKALLFTQYAEFGNLLRGHLTGRFGREVLFLHGGVPKAGRDEMVSRFQSDDTWSPPLFVLSLKAGGTGLTLTAANHVIHVDRWWNPAVEDQATDRAFRIGQRRSVQVRKFVCAGTVEEKIAAMISAKRGLAAKIVGTGEQWLTELSTRAARGPVAAGVRGGGGVMAGRFGDGQQRYPPSKPREVEGGLKARTARGSIGSSWWSRRFLDVLESFAMGSRLTRGRTYARKGQVISLDVTPGEVRSSVQGSRARPYQVVIKQKPFGELVWAKAEIALSEQALPAAKLLAGEVPPELEDIFSAAGAPLFPTRAGDLDQRCSCPDWEVPCKHLAATFYLLAEAFDDDPFLILLWRGRDRDRLLGRLRELRDDHAEESDEAVPAAAGSSLALAGLTQPDLAAGALLAASGSVACLAGHPRRRPGPAAAAASDAGHDPRR